MKRDADRWLRYVPESPEEKGLSRVAHDRVRGLISTLSNFPNTPLNDILASAYMQGASDMLEVALPMMAMKTKPHIKLKLTAGS